MGRMKIACSSTRLHSPQKTRTRVGTQALRLQRLLAVSAAEGELDADYRHTGGYAGVVRGKDYDCYRFKHLNGLMMHDVPHRHIHLHLHVHVHVHAHVNDNLRIHMCKYIYICM